jgi:hypothetical protein
MATAGAAASQSNATATRVSGSGCASGIRSDARLAVADQRECGGLHRDATGGARDPVRDVLGADVDHVRLPRGVEVGKMRAASGPDALAAASYVRCSCRLALPPRRRHVAPVRH